jgi:hypothetical protein
MAPTLQWVLMKGRRPYAETMVAINLAPAVVDVAGIRAGDRNLFQLTIRQGGKGINLTGYTISASARTTADEPTHLDAICTITDAVNGKVDVRFPGAAVRTWLGTESVQKGVWDLQLDDGSSGDPWTVISGSFAAELDVTHP